MKELVDSLTLRQIEDMLENLERRAQMAGPTPQRARTYNLAGDVCFDAGQPERGLAYYDKAITTFLENQQHESAAHVCEKILKLWPQAVRTYWTLAWLALKKGNDGAARVRIEQYVLAADRHGLGKVACSYLSLLADESNRVDVLEAIADGLLQLNDSRAANTVYGRMRLH